MGRKNQFSYSGKRALFDWLENLEDETKNEIELDVIALCCEYTEYANLAKFQQDYNNEEYTSIEDIAENTTVIRISDVQYPCNCSNDESFIIQAF